MTFRTTPLTSNYGIEVHGNAQLLHKRDAYKGPRFLKITRVFLSSDRFAIPD